MPGAGSKGVFLFLLMSNGCVLGVTWNKTNKSLISHYLKSQLRSCHGVFTIYMPEFAKVKTERVSREETERLVRQQIGSLILIHAMTIHYDMKPFLYLCSLHNDNLLHCNPFIFYIWHVCVLCVISRVCSLCGATYRRILLTRSLKNKQKNTVDFRSGFSWAMAQSISDASK